MSIQLIERVGSVSDSQANTSQGFDVNPAFTLLSDSGKSADDLVQALFLTPMGTSLSISDVTYTGNTAAVSFYDGSLEGLNIGAGILLTSGDGSPGMINNSSGYTIGWGELGDEDLLAAAKAGFGSNAHATYDASVLSFNINVNDASIKSVAIDLMLGSEEYPEFADSFVDIGVVIVNGVNYALANGSSSNPFSVLQDNIDQGFFDDNGTGTLPIQYDGISKKVTVYVPVIPGVNSIKIGVADTNDESLDTGLFVSNIRASEVDTGGLKEVIEEPNEEGIYEGTPNDNVFEGSDEGEIFDASAGGDDVVNAGGGDDVIIIGVTDDVVCDGGEGEDKVVVDENAEFLRELTEETEDGYILYFKDNTSAPFDTVTTTANIDFDFSLSLKSVEFIQFGSEGDTIELTDFLAGVDEPSVSLVKDSGIVGDNITNDAHLMLNGFSDEGLITYTLKQLDKKGGEVLLGKADTEWQGPSDGGSVLLSELLKGKKVKDGSYILTVNQGEIEATLDFKVDTAAPKNLSVSFITDTGSKSNDRITSDLTLKVTGMEQDAALQFRFKAGSDSAINGSDWMTISEDMISYKGKNAIVDFLDVITGQNGGGSEFDTILTDVDGWSDKVEFRQADGANVSKKATSLDYTYDAFSPSLIGWHSPSSLENGQEGKIIYYSNEQLVGLDKDDLSLDGELIKLIGSKPEESSIYDEQLGKNIWAYEFKVKADSENIGSVQIGFSDNASAKDLAGNILEFDIPSLPFIEIGVETVVDNFDYWLA